MNVKLACVSTAVVLVVLAVLPLKALSDPVAYPVSGSFVETVIAFAIAGPNGVKVHATDEFSGDLQGTAQLQIHSSEIADPQLPAVLNVIATRNIKTSEGHLFLAEVGERIGADVHATANVVGGTGKFKDAAGQLILTGLHGPGAIIEFTYVGTIILSQ